MRQWITPVALIALLLSIASLSLAQSDDTSPITRSSDFDGDGIVGFSDFLLFVEYFGTDHTDEIYKARFDLNGNGTIEFSDFLIFVSDFGKTVSRTVDMIDFPLRALSCWWKLGNQHRSCGRMGSYREGRSAYTFGLY